MCIAVAIFIHQTCILFWNWAEYSIFVYKILILELTENLEKFRHHLYKGLVNTYLMQSVKKNTSALTTFVVSSEYSQEIRRLQEIQLINWRNVFNFIFLSKFSSEKLKSLQLLIWYIWTVLLVLALLTSSRVTLYFSTWNTWVL